MDEAWKWLKENDPEFTGRKSLDYPYLSNRQVKHRKRKEIAISAVVDLRFRVRNDMDKDITAERAEYINMLIG